MKIDLRSDTVAKPTLQMKEFMFDARVGDDVFGEDPTVIELENKIACLFGMEAALFCPSGTMANQIALRINTEPQDEIICHKHSHIYNYEGGGAAYNSMVSMRLLDGDRGIISTSDILNNINPDDFHFAQTSLVALENTVNKGGGSYYDLKAISEISHTAKSNKLKMHLDGARIFNALTETRDLSEEYGQYFDTISVCFSKGLGAPVGSAILGSEAAIKKAKRVRKVFGGAMRQSGYLAAAAIYALDYHIERLKDDHQRAKQLANLFESKSYVTGIIPVDTNIVIISVDPNYGKERLLEELKSKGILGVSFGQNDIRFVTHLDFTDDMLEVVKSVI
ncbi:GntG family PLP-dependent aldolase [Reichenbachiella sp. MALMAid0571]|uniref:threonine aldolase family protein n=1 Tax=Reichenbachiella sp. MALMAid0571 TaxID=3143939 RepID=UPI0032E0552B